jgi:hypothetical protein
VLKSVSITRDFLAPYQRKKIKFAPISGISLILFI